MPDPEDAAACAVALGGTGELIVDVHTHHVMPDGPWRQAAPAMEEMIARLVPADCTDPDPLVCLDRLHYVHDLFLASDTTVAMLTDVPNSGPGDAPVPYAENLGTARFAASLAAGSTPRVLPQVVMAPNFGPLEGALDTITAYVESGHARVVQGVHRVGAGRPRLRARRPHDRPARHPAHPRPRRPHHLRAQGPAPAGLRPQPQRSRGHGRRGEAVPGPAVRRLPLGVRTRAERGPLRPRTRRAAAPARCSPRSTSTASHRTRTCGASSARPGARC